MKRAGLFVAVLLIFSLIPLIYAEGEAPGAPGITEMPFANETQKVQQQYQDGVAAGATGTPYNVIVAGDQKIPVNGAVPFEQLKAVIDPLLQQQ